MKRMLVCVDKVPGTDVVHQAALALARAGGASICFFHVIEGAGEVDTTNAELIGRAERELEMLALGDPPATRAGCRAVIGELPWRAICDAARQEEVDLIVVGARAYGVLARALGTTASKVVNHADRSVLVVR